MANQIKLARVNKFILFAAGTALVDNLVSTDIAISQQLADEDGMLAVKLNQTTIATGDIIAQGELRPGSGWFELGKITVANLILALDGPVAGHFSLQVQIPTAHRMRVITEIAGAVGGDTFEAIIQD